jgi:hypothetical protein
MLISASLIFLSAFMFGKLGVGAGKNALAVFHHVLDCGRTDSRLEAHNAHEDTHRQMKKQYIVTAVLLLLWVGVCVGCGADDSEGVLVRVQ